MPRQGAQSELALCKQEEKSDKKTVTELRRGFIRLRQNNRKKTWLKGAGEDAPRHNGIRLTGEESTGRSVGS